MTILFYDDYRWQEYGEDEVPVEEVDLSGVEWDDYNNDDNDE